MMITSLLTLSLVLLLVIELNFSPAINSPSLEAQRAFLHPPRVSLPARG
jgi:hypothetical protein